MSDIVERLRRADVRPEGLQRLLDLIGWSGKQGVAGGHGVSRLHKRKFRHLETPNREILTIQDLGPQDAKNAISGTSRRHARQKPHTLEHRPRRTLRRQA